jgi:hypothetical protein
MRLRSLKLNDRQKETSKYWHDRLILLSQVPQAFPIGDTIEDTSVGSTHLSCDICVVLGRIFRNALENQEAMQVRVVFYPFDGLICHDAG